MLPRPPSTEAELLERAQALAGLCLEELAELAHTTVPPDLRRAKGWTGLTLERVLGATAGSRATPDFEALGIELKTIPINRRGTPCESTFVCTVPLHSIPDVEWPQSRIRKKLDRVLWVPVQGEREIPVRQRVLGCPMLWSPNKEEDAVLRFDWEEFASVIGRGDADLLTGHIGVHLQVRPKAANGRVRRWVEERDGILTPTLPRGFYLRPSFTRRLLEANYRLA